MGIKAGTTISITFDAQQISQLDVVLQDYEMMMNSRPERAELATDWVNNIYKALHEAGYR